MICSYCLQPMDAPKFTSERLNGSYCSAACWAAAIQGVHDDADMSEM